VLGSAISASDGSFEIRGLPEGRVFLDGRSDGWFVRTPGTARLACGFRQAPPSAIVCTVPDLVGGMSA